MITVLVIVGVVGAYVAFTLGYRAGRAEGAAVAEDRWYDRVVTHQDWGTQGWAKYHQCMDKGPSGQDWRSLVAGDEEMHKTMPAFWPHDVGREIAGRVRQ